jgi:hypothetical protein
LDQEKEKQNKGQQAGGQVAVNRQGGEKRRESQRSIRYTGKFKTSDY